MLGSVASTLGSFALLAGTPQSGLLQPLPVLFGKLSGSLQRLGQLRQKTRGPLGALSRMSGYNLSSARVPALSLRLVELRPPTLEFRSTPLVLRHLTLKRSTRRVSATVPELRSALMVLRCHFVMGSRLPMVGRVVTHHRPSMRPREELRALSQGATCEATFERTATPRRDSNLGPSV